jgi:hypothetical protein
MFANRYTALIEACTLVSVWRRNLPLPFAEAKFFRVCWSARIFDKTVHALVHLLMTTSTVARSPAWRMTADRRHQAGTCHSGPDPPARGTTSLATAEDLGILRPRYAK